jgi:hypothetical protein
VSINWEEHRRTDGTLDLASAYQAQFNEDADDESLRFFDKIEDVMRISSRQVAAMLLVMANYESD